MQCVWPISTKGLVDREKKRRCPFHTIGYFDFRAIIVSAVRCLVVMPPLIALYVYYFVYGERTYAPGQKPPSGTEAP